MMATGIMTRIYTNSYFLRFHENSKLSDKLFSPKPMYENKEVSVVQIMQISDGYLLAEIVDNDKQ